MDNWYSGPHRIFRLHIDVFVERWFFRYTRGGR